MKVKATFYLIFVILTTACSTARLNIYENGILSREKSYSVDFAYEVREDELKISKTGVEKRSVKKGQFERNLALRDNISYGLRNNGFKILNKIDNPDILITIHSTIRQSNCQVTCGAFDTISIVFFETGNRDPIARIFVKNGSRTATTMDDMEFAEYVLKEILNAI